MEFKDRLKVARKKAKLTQAQLAEIIGVDQSSISDLERGKSQSSSYAYQIAEACGVNAAWLITGRDRADYLSAALGSGSVQEKGEVYEATETQAAAQDLAAAIIQHSIEGLLSKDNIETLKTLEEALVNKAKPS